MTLRNSWPGPSGVTTTTDARIVHGGLIDDFVSGTPRAGVFPSNLNPIVTARSDMNVDIAAFQAVANQFGGPILIANDGTIQLPAVLVSPASGTNFYVIYVKQDEATSPGTDADNLPKVGNTLSTVSFAAARALLPTGALELATVQVPTGVAATNAGGVTITQTFVYTVAEGGVLPLRNGTELTAWTPADGSLGWTLDAGQMWVRQGGAWTILGGAAPHFSFGRTTAFNFTTTLAVLTWDASPVDGSTSGVFTVSGGVFTCAFAGLYLINAEVTAGATITGNVQLQKNGTAVKVNNQISSGGNQSFIVAESVRLAVGDTIQVQIQATGTVGGVANATQTRITFDFLHI